MAINETIWGDETEWESAFFGVSKITRYALWDKVLSLDWTLNELVDNTVSYCGTIGDFYLNSLIYFTRTGAVNMYPDIEVGNTLFFTSREQYRSPNGYEMYNTDDSNRWSKYNTIYDMSQWTCARTSKLISKFKINKMLWIPYVECQATSNINDTTHEYRLDEYITSYHNDYPYITRVYMYPWYNSGTDESPQWSTAQENLDFYLWTQVNSFFSTEVDPNEEFSHYCLGGISEHRYQIPIMGLGRPGLQGIDDTPGFMYHPIGFDNNVNHYIFDNDENPTQVKYLRSYSDALVQEIYHQIAFYGVFFLGEGSGSYDNLTLTDPRVYVGVITEDGYAYGDYTHGEDNANTPQYSWEDSNDSNYDPSKPAPKPNNWSTDFPNKLNTIGRYLPNHWYILSENAIENFFIEVNNVDLETLDKNATYGLNPIDGILQVKRVYFRSDYAKGILDTSETTKMNIGELELDISPTKANKVEDNYIYDYDCDSLELIEPLPNFLSYIPFSSAVFYDAFCGVVEIDPAKILNKEVKVIQTVDFLSGDKITSLYSKDFDQSDKQYVRIATLTGNCSEDIPVNGQAVAEYNRNKYMTSNRMIVQAIGAVGAFTQGLASAVSSAASPNPAGAAVGVLQGLASLTNGAGSVAQIYGERHVTEHTIPSAVKISNGTSNAESGVVYPPMIILYPPKINENYNQKQYGLLTGFAGYKVATLESCGQGTHVVSHPRLDIPCTGAEMYLIQDQLQKGIYVKEEPEVETNL